MGKFAVLLMSAMSVVSFCGCGDAIPPGLKCSSDGKCPDGYMCVSDICVKNGQTDFSTSPNDMAMTTDMAVVNTCNDGKQDGVETDVDCGGNGNCPTRCVDGGKCKVNGDCSNQNCISGICYPSNPCTDGVKDLQETDVDCGGMTCAKCADGKDCSAASDCVDGVCDATMHCAAATCGDGVRNGTETDVDCGGTCPAKCASGKNCKVAADCMSTICNATGLCVAATCSDGMRDGAETDVDCGGGSCAPCGNAKTCATGPDCASGFCGATSHECYGCPNMTSINHQIAMTPVKNPGTGYYCIDATEVTAGEYDAFYATGPDVTKQDAVCAWNTSFKRPSGTPSMGANQPAYVNWCQAVAYCAHLNKHLCGTIGTGQAVPYTSFSTASQDEWYNACSSGGANSYPYTGSFDVMKCNGDTRMYPDALLDVASLTSCMGGATLPYGYYVNIYDMSGNATEWENSCQANTGASDACRVRGGQYNTAAAGLACATDLTMPRNFFAGFRCCALEASIDYSAN